MLNTLVVLFNAYLARKKSRKQYLECELFCTAVTFFEFDTFADCLLVKKRLLADVELICFYPSSTVTRQVSYG